MITSVIAPLRLHNVGALSDSELLSSLKRAERGACYASFVELVRYAIDRGLELDEDGAGSPGA